MLLDKSLLEKIKTILEKKYTTLLLSFNGKSYFSNKELEELKSKGIDIERASTLELIYKYNYLNSELDDSRPKTLKDAKLQIENTNLTLKNRQKTHIEAAKLGIEGLLEQAKSNLVAEVSNSFSRINNQINAEESFDLIENAKNKSLSQFRQLLKQASDKSNRSWQTMAITEVSNLVGHASLDRITETSEGQDANEIYVYRLIADSQACPWCKKFYGIETPKLYRLSTLIANGSNYGKKKSDWKAVVGATHPNTRTSQILKLQKGYALEGRTQTFIGLEKWPEYIKKTLEK